MCFPFVTIRGNAGSDRVFIAFVDLEMLDVDADLMMFCILSKYSLFLLDFFCFT